MKIVYGINGAGLGHATRSLTLIQHCISQGHDVIVFSHGKAKTFLQHQLPQLTINTTPSYTHVYNNSLRSYLRCALNVLLPHNQYKKYRFKKHIQSLKPDIILTDDEISLPFIASKLKIPYISLSFHNYLLYHTNTLSLLHRIRLKTLKAIKLTHYRKAALRFNTSPFECLRHQTTITNMPSLLPQKIRSSTWSPKRTHIVVYFNQRLPINYHLLPTFAKQQHCGVSFYGTIPCPLTQKNQHFATPHDDFLNDLLSADALICTPGSQIACEAAIIGLPTILISPPKQATQQLTATLFDHSFANIQHLRAKHVTLERLQHALDLATPTHTPSSSHSNEGTHLIYNAILATHDKHTETAPH